MAPRMRDPRWEHLLLGLVINLFILLGLSLVTLILASIWADRMAKRSHQSPGTMPSEVYVPLNSVSRLMLL